MFIRFVKCLIFIMLFSSIASGQYDTYKYSIGVNLGYSQFNIDEVIELTTQGNGDFESNQGGISINGNFSYHISKLFFLTLNGGYSILTNSGSGFINRTSSIGPVIIGLNKYTGKYDVSLIPISLTPLGYIES